MIHLFKKTDPTKMILLATSEEDVAVFNILWDKHLLFGAWNMADLTKLTPEHPNYEKFNPFKIKYPTALSIMQINIVENFVEPIKDGHDASS